MLKLLLVLLIASVTKAQVTYGKIFTGSITFYGAGSDSGGKCSFQNPRVDLSNKLPTVAIGTFGNAEKCGTCVEITPLGTGSGNSDMPKREPFVAFVNNQCPECGDNNLDLAETGDGRWDINWRYVDCPTTGNIDLQLKVGSSIWWTEIQARNFKVAIQSIEYLINGAWVLLLRRDYNYFDYQTTVTLPVQARITSVVGEQQIITITSDNYAKQEPALWSTGIQFTKSSGSISGTVSTTITPPPDTTTPPPDTITPPPDTNTTPPPDTTIPPPDTTTPPPDTITPPPDTITTPPPDTTIPPPDTTTPPPDTTIPPPDTTTPPPDTTIPPPDTTTPPPDTITPPPDTNTTPPPDTTADTSSKVTKCWYGPNTNTWYVEFYCDKTPTDGVSVKCSDTKEYSCTLTSWGEYQCYPGTECFTPRKAIVDDVYFALDAGSSGSAAVVDESTSGSQNIDLPIGAIIGIAIAIIVILVVLVVIVARKLRSPVIEHV